MRMFCGIYTRRDRTALIERQIFTIRLKITLTFSTNITINVLRHMSVRHMSVRDLFPHHVPACVVFDFLGQLRSHFLIRLIKLNLCKFRSVRLRSC